MRVFGFIEYGDVVEFDVEVLVAGLEGAADEEVVLQLDGEGRVGESFEEREEKHGGDISGMWWRWWCGVLSVFVSDLFCSERDECACAGIRLPGAVAMIVEEDDRRAVKGLRMEAGISNSR